MINISPQAVLDMPVDELALHVLKDFVQSIGQDGSTISYTYQYQEDTVRGFRNQPRATLAIAEAIEWLRGHGMLATKPNASASQFVFVTRLGNEALKMELKDIKAIERLQDNLHPIILRKARPQFLLGEYEQAVFISMKQVEIKVRKLADLSNNDTGVDLMIKAFKAGGPLADKHAPPGEVQGTMMLFAGAYAVLRNPSGHREVEYDDITEASEAVLTASLLMRILDKVAAR